MQPDTQTDLILRTIGLSKTYCDFWGRARVKALEPLDLHVKRGEVFGLLGPNGSGKTTTIKLLLGLLRPTAGEAFVFDRDPSDRAAKRRLGYLPEETYLYRFLTADETLRFFGKLFSLGGNELDERIDHLITLVGLDHARSRRLGEYSKGMARRLGLAQALINDPELVILDEPTSGLDPLGSAEVKDLILSLKAQGKTILLSSHLLADVEDVCDRIAILYQGRLLQCGKVSDLLSNPEAVTVQLKDRSNLEAVKQAAGDSLQNVDRPRERLEAYFRAIIQGARQGPASRDGTGPTVNPDKPASEKTPAEKGS